MKHYHTTRRNTDHVNCPVVNRRGMFKQIGGVRENKVRRQSGNGNSGEYVGSSIDTQDGTHPAEA